MTFSVVILLIAFLWNFRNFGLLSFGVEAEEDEVETDKFVQKNANKSKSVHDVADDPKLSKQALKIDKQQGEHETTVESDDELALKEKTGRVRDKLKTKTTNKSNDKVNLPESDSDDDLTDELEKERKLKRQKKA